MITCHQSESLIGRWRGSGSGLSLGRRLVTTSRSNGRWNLHTDSPPEGGAGELSTNRERSGERGTKHEARMEHVTRTESHEHKVG